MVAVAWWQVVLGLAVPIILFGGFLLVMLRARRHHTRRFGGITYWQLLGMRDPNARRRRKG
jgi:hypothetical protein